MFICISRKKEKKMENDIISHRRKYTDEFISNFIGGLDLESIKGWDEIKIDEEDTIKYLPGGAIFRIQVWRDSPDYFIPDTVASTNVAYTGEREDDIAFGIRLAMAAVGA